MKKRLKRIIVNIHKRSQDFEENGLVTHKLLNPKCAILAMNKSCLKQSTKENNHSLSDHSYIISVFLSS